MTERMIENRIKKLQSLEAQMKELEEQAEALKRKRPYAHSRAIWQP